MKVLIDLNVTLDFLQGREPFFEDAAAVIDAVLYSKVIGVMPAHAMTTLYYLLSKSIKKDDSSMVMRWLLENFEISPADRSIFTSALDSALDDYEDAVVASCAAHSECAYIITRNIEDFEKSAVPAITPATLLQVLD